MGIAASALQAQYDAIYAYFKTTSEQFDALEWDGSVLHIVKDNAVIERYSAEDLQTLIKLNL